MAALIESEKDRMKPIEYRGWRIELPNLNEEPRGVWWTNGQIEEIVSGETEPVALADHFRSNEDAQRAYFIAARRRIAAKR